MTVSATAVAGPVGGALASSIGGALESVVGFVEGLIGSLSSRIDKELDALEQRFPALSRSLIESLSTTERVSAGGLLGLFGVKREQIDQGITGLKLDIANSIAGGLASALSDGLRAFAEGRADWKDALREGIKSTLLQGILDAFVQSAILKAGVQDIIGDFTEVLFADGAEAAASFARGALEGLIPILTEGAEALMSAVGGAGLLPETSTPEKSMSRKRHSPERPIAS